MPSDDPLERLRSAIDRLVASDAQALIDDARFEARARVQSRLADLMERSMLESVREHFAISSQPEARALVESSADPEPDTAPLQRERDTNPPEPGPELEPEQEPETGPAWYVYGVVAGETDLHGSVPGVDPSRQVQLLTDGPVAAAVSEVALEEFGEASLRDHLRDMGWVEKVARSHERVLEALRARATVIPMRMCSVYRSELGVRDMLRREAAALSEALDHLAGKAEWGVKVFADPRRMATIAASEEGDVTQEARGAAYMRRRLSERDQRERARQQLEEGAIQIHERLGALADDGHMIPPQRPEVSGHSGDMVLNGVYLLSDDGQERFRAEVQILEAEFAPMGLELELTGPWPAYNFVPGTIGATW